MRSRFLPLIRFDDKWSALSGRETLSLSFFFKIGLKWFFAVILTARLSLRHLGVILWKRSYRLKIFLGVAGATLRLPDDDMNDNEMDKNFNRNSVEPKSKLAKNMDMQNNVGNVAIINHEKKVTQKCRKINLETMVRFSWPKLCQTKLRKIIRENAWDMCGFEHDRFKLTNFFENKTILTISQKWVIFKDFKGHFMT